ncbi:MAG: hypothetical protein NQU46_05130 [Methanolinea sp.]|nr:hypothetical protein [Methanolinea sp.]
MKWRRASAGILLCILLFPGFLFSGCLNSPEGTVRDTSNTGSWRSITLRDITTGENFTLDSLGSTPVILFTFIVACPIYTRQQQEITQFKREMGEGVAVVGLDIDPNEDEKTLRTHIERYSQHSAGRKSKIIFFHTAAPAERVFSANRRLNLQFSELSSHPQ